MMKAQPQQTERQRLQQRLDEARQALSEARVKQNQSEQDLVNAERQIKGESNIDTLAVLQTKRDALVTLQPRLRLEVEKRQRVFDDAKNAITRNESFIVEVQRNIANAHTVRSGLLRRKSQAEEEVRQAQVELRRAENAIENHDREVKGYESQLMSVGG